MIKGAEKTPLDGMFEKRIKSSEGPSQVRI
jgi:hypothetical protein